MRKAKVNGGNRPVVGYSVVVELDGTGATEETKAKDNAREKKTTIGDSDRRWIMIMRG